MENNYHNPNDHWYYNQKYDSRSNKNLKGCFYSVVLFILAVCISLIFFSCKSIQYVPVPEYHHDSIYFTQVQFDSIYQHDSIYIKEYTKGDTVYLEHTKWHTKYKEKEVHDTIYQSKVDSIRVPYPVERQLTKWQKIKMDIGGIAVGLCFLLLIIVVGFIVSKKSG